MLFHVAHYSPAMVCLHFPQGLFQLLNQVEEGRRVGLQHLGSLLFVLVKM